MVLLSFLRSGHMRVQPKQHQTSRSLSTLLHWRLRILQALLDRRSDLQLQELHQREFQFLDPLHQEQLQCSDMFHQHQLHQKQLPIRGATSSSNPQRGRFLGLIPGPHLCTVAPQARRRTTLRHRTHRRQAWHRGLLEALLDIKPLDPSCGPTIRQRAERALRDGTATMGEARLTMSVAASGRLSIQVVPLLLLVRAVSRDRWLRRAS